MAASSVTIMTPEQVAKRWQIDPRTVRKMLRDGLLKGFKTGTASNRAQWRVLVSEVERYESEGANND